MSEIRRHFDRAAASYPPDIGDAHAQLLKWDILARHAVTGTLAADIGAAGGRHALLLAERGLTVVALDISTAMVGAGAERAAARELSARVLAVAGALPELPLAPGHFDLVLCYSTLLLLPHAGQRQAIAALAGLLRPGGTLVVDLAGAHCLAIHYWRRHYRRLGLPGIFGHSLRAARRLLAGAGLTIVEIHPQGVLSQLLLLPGLCRLPGVEATVRGAAGRRGLDDCVSRWLPGLAERWYVVARQSVTGDD